MNDPIQTILQTFQDRGGERYGEENVTQLQHALQCAELARIEGASPALITAAMLHDLGHIMEPGELPDSCEDNLDDHHEMRAYQLLQETFGPDVAEPVRLHVVAKRYLCTKDPEYADRLSPTSYKSFLDQGGTMSEAEVAAFEAEPFFTDALRVRKWDDTGKRPEHETPTMRDFLAEIEACRRV